jgi:hypothetical protein
MFFDSLLIFIDLVLVVVFGGFAILASRGDGVESGPNVLAQAFFWAVSAAMALNLYALAAAV